MPPIVPPTPDLLTAPAAINASGVAPIGLGIGVVDAPIATSRRLTISYQDQGTTPVAPQIEAGIDIAQPLLERFAQYTADRSQVNNISIQTPQQRYINTIPNAEDEFNRVPTQFRTNLVVSDPLGQNFKKDDASGPRNFNINQYNRLFVDTNQAAEHGVTIDKTLLATRGHNASNEYITSDITQNKDDNKITLGSYFYKSIGNRVNYASGSYVAINPETLTAAPPMSIEQMKDVGLNIMFEAAQGEAGLDFTIRSNNSGDTAEAEVRMGIPSLQRIGKRVSLGRFTSAYQIKKLTGAEKPNNANFIDNTDDVQTYGSLYNPYAQFDSLISVGQIALAVAMILAYVLVLSGLTALINVFNKLGEGTPPTAFANLSNVEKHRLLGASVLQNSGVYPLSEVDGGDILTQFLGITGIFLYTRHRAEECLNAGIQEFFGLSFAGFGTTAGNEGAGIGAGQQVASTALKVLTENGRLNVVLREILRSGISLVEDASADFTGGASIAGIGNLVRKIRDLKIVRFINVLMVMGDKVKFEFDIRARAGANLKVDNKLLLADGSNTSYVDSLPDNRPNYVSKSRLGDQKEGLIWSNASAGMLSLPLANAGQGSFKHAGQTAFGSDNHSHWSDIGLTVETPEKYNEAQLLHYEKINIAQRVDAVNNGRISADIVESVENVLEADYMPFYIHDLRTNEILSFHAFLEDASEDFNIEYTAQEGYGRMDKVQIYKGTTRNISVNFKMAATNPGDHDLMWYKINRLAMMIYPQWTQGRKVSVENINFIQPFSQIPGATPVIRLRLGDLYKTNYSKMAVARLFGITTDKEYNVDGSRQIRRNNNNSATNAPAVQQTDSSTKADSTPRERSNLLLGSSQLGSITQTVNVPARSRRGHHTAATSISTRAISEVFTVDDDIVFIPDSFPNLRNYKLNTGTVGDDTVEGNIPTGTHVGRILAKFIRFSRSSSDKESTGIVVRPERYLFNTANGIQSGHTEDIRTGASRPIVGRNGAAPEVTITIAHLNNSRIFDKASTANILQSKGRTEQVQQAAAEPAADSAISDMRPTEFYNPDKNPIMKAFKSSGGRGLAGVITSFKVDYGEAKGSWGLDGSKLLRAPMFVTVQLQMAVIHDITPGLDANGIMMAPIWPVGKTSNYFINNGTIGSNQTNNGNAPPTQATPASGQPTTPQNAPNDFFAVDGGKPLYYNRKD